MLHENTGIGVFIEVEDITVFEMSICDLEMCIRVLPDHCVPQEHFTVSCL